jgi:hypothetical protein
MRTHTPNGPPRAEFEHRIRALGAALGREDSFKLARSLVLADRTMLGMRTKGLSCADVLSTCRSLDMPRPYEAVIEANYDGANVVLFGLEPRADGCTVKVYLEFWDRVRERVRETNSRTPLLLNLGVKWERGQASRHGLARYTCFPLLSTGEIIARIDALLADANREILSAGLDIVRLAAQRAPGTAFVYLECEEEGNPRRSYDINLYRSGLRLADIRPFIDRACALFGCPSERLWEHPGDLADRLLGHVSGGIGRDGNEFMTVYYEIEPLP